MYAQDFLIVFVFTLLVFSPTIWIMFGVYKIHQWMQRVDELLEKAESKQKDGK
jgi:hypothetical protein